MAKGYKRKTFFFKNSPQGKYILSYFILAGLVTLLFTILFIYFSSDTLSITYDNNDLKIGQTPKILMDMILSIHGILIFVCGFSIIYFATHFTHRTAGPIFKISRTIEEMINGDMSVRIFLRQKDDYQEIAEQINRFNSIMYKKIKDIETISYELNEQLKKDRQKHQSDSAFIEGSSLDHDTLVSINEKLKTTLSFFNLSGDRPPD